MRMGQYPWRLAGRAVPGTCINGSGLRADSRSYGSALSGSDPGFSTDPRDHVTSARHLVPHVKRCFLDTGHASPVFLSCRRIGALKVPESRVKSSFIVTKFQGGTCYDG